MLLLAFLRHIDHYETEWLGFCSGGNATHIHDFRIPLDFLGTKDLQKNEKRPKKNFKGHRQGHSYTY